jgi:hypothetical protein
MVSFRYLAAGFVMFASRVGGAAAQEPSRSPDLKPAPGAPSNDKSKLKGINCKHGIACPISIPAPDVPLDTTAPSPSRP